MAASYRFSAIRILPFSIWMSFALIAARESEPACDRRGLGDSFAGNPAANRGRKAIPSSPSLGSFRLIHCGSMNLMVNASEGRRLTAAVLAFPAVACRRLSCLQRYQKCGARHFFYFPLPVAARPRNFRGRAAARAQGKIKKVSCAAFLVSLE